jgi:SnoaL-like domain
LQESRNNHPKSLPKTSPQGFPCTGVLTAAKGLLGVPLSYPRLAAQMIDKIAILDANAAFYVAFLHADMRHWSAFGHISCLHPGWPAIVGRMAIICSWQNIVSNPHVTFHDSHAIAMEPTGRVVCIELVGDSPSAASNHFRFIKNEWRLVHRQPTPFTAVVEGRFRQPPVGQLH